MRNTIVASLVVVLTGAATLTVSEEVSPRNVREAVGRSLDYIEREGFAWMDGRVPIQEGKGCVSCHHVGYAVWSLREAKRRGMERAETQLELLERRAISFFREVDCRAASCGPLLLARGQEGKGPDLQALFEQLTNIQSDGHWRARGQFPTQRRPIEESDAVVTMWTMLAQRSFCPADAEHGKSQAAAQDWVLARGAGESAEWLVARLLVERRAGRRDASELLARQLLERQNSDGGWPWRPDQESDAMTTGQAVYALAVAGDPDATGESLRRGVSYLLSTQSADGTWITPSELISTEPSSAKDYVYNFWGTSWASIGMAHALDRLSGP